MPRALELFAGCGGMATGLRLAGIEHARMYDFEPKCIATLHHNGFHEAELADVTKLDFRAIGPVDMVCGGPPCQPFSSAGSHLGPLDPRDCWPHAVRAVRELLPRCFLFENVANFVSRRYADYSKSVLDELSSLGYTVTCNVVDCSDYGVAQRRKRVIVVGFRDEADAARFVPPEPASGARCTLRTAIADLGPPDGNGDDGAMHARCGSARRYKNRTGSVLDAPAKTVIAGKNGPGGGNNMFTDDDGVLRHFTLREAARVQTFPDDFRFPSGTSWSSAFKQLGNAAPPLLVRQFAESIVAALGEGTTTETVA